MGQSRTEDILRATIDGTEYKDKPQSREEELLIELKEAIEAGGGGGGGGVTKAYVDTQDAKKVDKVPGKGLSTNDYDDTAKGIVDGVTSALADKVDKEAGKGLSTNDYDNTAKGIVDGVTSALSGKVDKETGKGLSTNDYTDTDKGVVDGVTTALAGKADVDDVIDGAVYDSTNHLILFKNGTTTLFSLDAAAFVKDGMVDDAEISGGNLVITFNTDAGKQAISIPLTDIFDPANYYNKTTTDNLLADKADKVASATNGNFAGLDSNGNPTDSGKKAADFQPVIPEAFTGDLNTLSVRGFHQYAAAYTDLTNAPTVSYTVNKCYIDVWSDGAGNVCQIIKLVGLTYDPAAKYCDIFKRSCYSTGSALSWGAWEKQNGKTDLITSPTNNNLVAMDANGNIKDSGISPSSVASKSATLLTSSDDLNNVTTPGFYYTVNTDNPSNIPSGTNLNNNIIEVIKQGSVARCVQLFYSINGQKMWFRIGNDVTTPTSWSSWEQIAFGSLATKADKVASATAGNLASLDANGNLVDSRISKNTVLDSGICAHGENFNSLESRTIMSYLNSLGSNIKFATFYVMPNATNVTDKIDTTNVYTYSCYRTGGSLATWVITAIATVNTSLVYVASFGSGSTEITWEKLVTESDITPSGTRKTTHRNYTNITSQAVFDTDGVLTKTPTELINALKNKGYVTATSGYEQLHCVINFVNSNSDKVIISDGTRSIDLVNGWIEFEGAFVSGTSTFGSEERWVMKLYNVSTGEMAIVTKRAGASLNPVMKSVALT